MYIEKNICENNFGTVPDIEGVAKHDLNAHSDLKEMGIRRDPHLFEKTGSGIT